MANRTFRENLVQILGGVYGNEVRMAIHDALQQAYDHGTGEGTGEVDTATNATLDSFSSALCYVLGITATKVYDSANRRYIYNMALNESESGGSVGYMPIDDDRIGANTTWSSNKINAETQNIKTKLQSLIDEFKAIEGALGEL